MNIHTIHTYIYEFNTIRLYTLIYIIIYIHTHSHPHAHKKTHAISNKYVKNILGQFMNEQNVTDGNITIRTVDELIENGNKPIIIDLLKSFYAGVRTKNGELYKSCSMLAIRAALARMFLPDIDIINDTDFNISNEVFQAMLKKLKREGKGTTIHKETMEKRHELQLSEYFTNNIDKPRGLQQYVWFTIMYYGIRRGREGLRELQKTSFQLQQKDGKRFIIQVIILASIFLINNNSI